MPKKAKLSIEFQATAWGKKSVSKFVPPDSFEDMTNVWTDIQVVETFQINDTWTKIHSPVQTVDKPMFVSKAPDWLANCFDDHFDALYTNVGRSYHCLGEFSQFLFSLRFAQKNIRWDEKKFFFLWLWLFLWHFSHSTIIWLLPLKSAPECAPKCAPRWLWKRERTLWMNESMNEWMNDLMKIKEGRHER